jgi:hypothetical protein
VTLIGSILVGGASRSAAVVAAGAVLIGTTCVGCRVHNDIGDG